VHPDDLATAASSPRRRALGELHRIEFRAARSGSWVWLEAVGTNLLDDAVVRGVVMNMRTSPTGGAPKPRQALQNQQQDEDGGGGAVSRADRSTTSTTCSRRSTATSRSPSST
jgi:hypothetical protein